MMAEDSRKGLNSALLEIKKKFRLSFGIISFVTITLFAVIVRYIYEPLSDYLRVLPDLSITLIIGISFFLAILGLYLFIMISRQVMRIIQDYSNRLERILDITRDLREEVHGDILLEKILDNALAITHSEAGSILLLDRGDLVFKTVRGRRADLLTGKTVAKGKGIAGWVAERGTPMRIADAKKDERFNAEIDDLTGYETKSLLCVPLKTVTGVVGVLELLNKRDGNAYREQDEEIIVYLAEQAAISIIKTKFYEDQKNYEIHLTEMLLEAIDFQIPEKKGHSRRVARYSILIAKTLAMAEEAKKRLYFGSLLHDVGFLKIHSDHAFKQEEFVRHPVLGYEMIRPINFYAGIAPFILCHHERFDGHGYPSGLKGREIPLEARIIAVAEAFDAMVSLSSYKIPLSFDEAIAELKNKAGTQFDPELVDAFVNSIEIQHTKI
jgi:HD-GYP domain-containing protein (c-di-GMP phosphodiesterase class II)